MNPNLLTDLVNTQMPFGKYKGRLICDLPESYLVWFHTQGFPPGKLGEMIGTMYEIRLNGLEYLLQAIKNKR